MNQCDTIRARLANATPGPWVEEWQDGALVNGIIQIPDCYDAWRADARLIVHAPDDIAYLLDVAECLHDLLDAVDGDEWHSCQDCKVEGRVGGDDPCRLCMAIAKARGALGCSVTTEGEDEDGQA